MDIEQQFPARYWINLGRRQDRRFETEWQLEMAGITAERFPAVDARFVRKNRGYESAGRYALALSQRLAIRKAMLTGAEAVLILEDDVIFHPDLKARLAEITLPEDWGIFYLGCAHVKRPWPAGPGIVQTHYALDTHAFAVNARYYKRVIAALDARIIANRGKSHPQASDWYLANLHQEIPTYACYPNLAWQAVAASDLAGVTYSNYTTDGSQISAAGETLGLGAEVAGGTRWKWPAPVNLPESPEKPEFFPPTPRIGVLFLTHGGLNQPECWQKWLEAAAGEARGFAHIKTPESVEEEWFLDLQIPETVKTAWADISLVRAMLALLREAIQDATLTHFAFVSESCIPIKSWAETRRRLAFDGRSMIGFEATEPMREYHRQRFDAVPWMEPRCRQVHPPWVMLNREAAECLLEDDFTDRFAEMFAPDEHYIGSVLAMKGYPIDETHILRQCPTWIRRTENSDGPMSPDVIHTVPPGLRREWLDFPGFFARNVGSGAECEAGI